MKSWEDMGSEVLEKVPTIEVQEGNQPECCIAANETNIHKCFVEYEKVLHDFKITSPVQIWSSDDT